MDGVTLNKKSKKWQVFIRVDKRNTYIGTFDDEESAKLARVDAENKYFKVIKCKHCGIEFLQRHRKVVCCSKQCKKDLIKNNIDYRMYRTAYSKMKYTDPEYAKKKKEYNDRANPKRAWSRSTLYKHKFRGAFDIKITIDELEHFIKDTEHCDLCKVPLDWSRGTKGGKILYNSPTLDRKNNEHFIALDNIMILCHRCNSGKNEDSVEEYVERCKRVVLNNYSQSVITK